MSCPPAKARALVKRRYNVSNEDITALAAPILRHRLLLNFHAESDKVDADAVVKKVFEAIPVPRA